MLDPKLLRTDLETVAANLARRGYVVDTERYRLLEERRKQLQVEADELRNRRNRDSKAIGKAKAAGEDIQPLLQGVAELGDRLKKTEGDLNEVQEQLDAVLMDLPNLLDASVPAGQDESDCR